VEIRPGWPLICHPAAQRFAYLAQRTDSDQIDELDSFIQHINPGAVLIDVGAHFGIFSFAVLHYGGPSARAIAIDPSPMAAEFVKKQAKLNRVTDRLNVVQAAISDRVGWQSMVAAGIVSSGYYVAPSRDHTSGESTLTRTTTLDQLVKDFGVSPSHVKIDVEGYEFAALNGGVKLLSSDNAPLLFVELHNEIVRQNGGSPDEILRLLTTLGYERFATNGGRLDDQTILDRSLIRIVAKRSHRGFGQ